MDSPRQAFLDAIRPHKLRLRALGIQVYELEEMTCASQRGSFWPLGLAITLSLLTPIWAFGILGWLPWAMFRTDSNQLFAIILLSLLALIGGMIWALLLWGDRGWSKRLRWWSLWSPWASLAWLAWAAFAITLMTQIGFPDTARSVESRLAAEAEHRAPSRRSWLTPKKPEPKPVTQAMRDEHDQRVRLGYWLLGLPLLAGLGVYLTLRRPPVVFASEVAIKALDERASAERNKIAVIRNRMKKEHGAAVNWGGIDWEGLAGLVGSVDWNRIGKITLRAGKVVAGVGAYVVAREVVGDWAREAMGTDILAMDRGDTQAPGLDAGSIAAVPPAEAAAPAMTAMGQPATSVEPYLRGGEVVRGHYRTFPDGMLYNNLSEGVNRVIGR